MVKAIITENSTRNVLVDKDKTISRDENETRKSVAELPNWDINPPNMVIKRVKRG